MWTPNNKYDQNQVNAHNRDIKISALCTMSDAQFPFGKMPTCKDTDNMQHSARLWLKSL